MNALDNVSGKRTTRQRADLKVVGNNISTKAFHIYDYDKNILVFVIFSHALANKVNARLGGYYKDIRIKKGEEPIFKISRHKFDELKTMPAFKRIEIK